MARIDKINEEVKRELANIIRELKDTRIPLMTSVVTVNVTNDLKMCIRDRYTACSDFLYNIVLNVFERNI